MPALWSSRRAVAVLALSSAVGGVACGETARYEPGEELSGGETTVFDSGRNAFTLPARNLHAERRNDFFTGNALFNRNWVTAPASTTGLDGLGPTFNAASCSSCHAKDGRGQPPTTPGQPFVGLLLRLSVPGTNEHGGPVPEPTYGDQFQHHAILGVASEGAASVTYEPVPGQFVDGTPYELQRPVYAFDALSFGPLAPDTLVSPRVAQAMVGLGLLESIPEATIVALEDPDDRDGDGISGRANRVWDPRSQTVQLGRFGWKANQPGIEQQTAGAFAGDIGITSSLSPDENCPASQPDCSAAITGGAPELSEEKLFEATYYSNLLAVPGRRDFQDPVVLDGKALFNAIGCAGCHTPALQTGARSDYPELEHQAIRPYSDLLLHDLGDALGDGRPDFLANGTEWRTPPLWGIGLVSVVNRHTRFLHDGRARDLTEAVLWHGGEAEASREEFRALDAADRAAVIRFLESL